MENSSIYDHPHIKKHLLRQYEDYLQLFECEIERDYVQTRFGKTHVLKLGKEDGQPLFIFHGANCLNPMTLSWFKRLFAKYKVYAPDLIGHPGYSDETRICPEDDSFALWVSDLLDHYGIEKCSFAGVSYGSGIVLRLAAYYPEKISCAILVVPTGICAFSKWWLIQRMSLSFTLYQLTDSTKYRKAIANAMSAGSMKAIDEEIIGTIFQHVSLERNLPKLSLKKELRHYHAPTLVIAGMQDVFFPENKLFKKAADIFGNLLEWRAYNMGHFPSHRYLECINGDMISFLHTHYREEI
ncbi:alpha/beta fold hydrolase [Bacillus aerolatus]|uniref:Alpha/beta fold hydrolase n=1 Tax=Bacillus aerolatus TaxID=2653354 RepID=A0A6I1FG76_9BACI|nr:alpha/beta hydrolase [Bacillus aerolatus]KAB7707163.1 alpha/beta fold hydrolase [Bacillus aerolatus]